MTAERAAERKGDVEGYTFERRLQGHLRNVTTIRTIHVTVTKDVKLQSRRFCEVNQVKSVFL